MQQFYKLTSSLDECIPDNTNVLSPVRLRHVLPNTLFTICLTDIELFMMQSDGSIVNLQQLQTWISLERFCEETGYNLDTTLDAWKGEVINPDWGA